MTSTAFLLARARLLRTSLGFAGITLIVFGGIYSLVGVGLGRTLFPSAATGSLIGSDHGAIGSTLIAQPFKDARYFQPRPSAADYDPMAAAASNIARTNPALRARIAGETANVARRDGIQPSEVPGDLVTQSGGGLDPDITPKGADVQVARVARARRLDPGVVRKLVADETEYPRWGILGQPRVNVLRLNIALDSMER